MIRLILISSIIVTLTVKPIPESKLNFTDYCNKYEYPSESHQIKTEDGYLLTFFRIQAKYTKIKKVKIKVI